MRRTSNLPSCLLLALLGCGPAGTLDVLDGDRGPRNDALRAAAHAEGVPWEVLAAHAYLMGRLEPAVQPEGAHAPLERGVAHVEEKRFGLMHLLPSQLDRGAALTSHSRESIETLLPANAEAFAALLREEALADAPWDRLLEAAARLAHPEGGTALHGSYARELGATLDEGLEVTLSDGERVRVPPVLALEGLGRTMKSLGAPGELPPMDFYPAHPNNQTARRGQVRYIVIHDTEGSYWSAVSWFQAANPPQASAHYVIRSSDGHITQMVDEDRTAWHAGNEDLSHHSIGIEHEGKMSNPGFWYTEAMYRASARLVCALARRHAVPVDRQHIIGHYQVPDPGHLGPGSAPGTNEQIQAQPHRYGGISNHQDPGPYGSGWSWDHYLSLVRECVDAANGKDTGASRESPPARATLNRDGRLEVFATARDGTVRHAWQLAPGGSWSGLHGLGGSITSQPVVGQNADGRLEVFVRGTDGRLWHTWQLGTDGWSPAWDNLGGADIVSEPAVAANADGRLEVFVRRADGSLWSIHQETPGGRWSLWFRRGEGLAAGPSVARNSDGRLEVFGLGRDGALWHLWQHRGLPGGWSALYPLTGTGFSSAPTVTANADGRLEVFGVDGNGELWHAWQTATPGEWSRTERLGGSFASAVSVGLNANGSLEVFGRGRDGGVLHAWQDEAHVTGWSGVYPLGGGAVAEAPSVARNGDGRLELFAPGPDGALLHAWQEPKGGWSGFYPLGGL